MNSRHYYQDNKNKSPSKSPPSIVLFYINDAIAWIIKDIGLSREKQIAADFSKLMKNDDPFIKEKIIKLCNQKHIKLDLIKER
jgi:hypothetical protein